MKKRELALFLLASLALCGAVFRSALWGGTLLAPLDVLPAFFTHFRYMDPATDLVPSNHYITDQLSMDLPFQWSMHRAVRRGEMPWWDPYTFGGRPLIAEAHCNGADPVRQLIYRAVPDFVLAYNWTLIAHSLLTGLGLFHLLRRLGFAPTLSGGLALAGQCSGYTALYFAHPWIQGTFLYYPWLWLAWLEAGPAQPRRWRLAAPLLVGGAFCAGNLQSHAYLPAFAFIFCASPAPWSWRHVGARIWRIAPSLFLGAMLAMPFLLPELELFRLNQRTVEVNQPASFTDGPLLLASVYPWALGTFRSLNYHNSLAFQIYFGTAAFLLAAFGAFGRTRAEWIPVRRLALAVLGFYFVIASTRLINVFYMRISGLPVIAMVVLAAIGTTRLVEEPDRFRRAWRWLAALAVLIPLLSYAMAWWIYPRWLEPKALQAMLAHAAEDWFGGTSAKLREFQARSYPHEITFGNPEVLCAWLSLLLLTVWLARPTWRRPLLPLLLALNLLAPLLFLQRFIVRADLVLWQRLLEGGAEQKRVAALLRPRHLRLWETYPGYFAPLFPMGLANFYEIHTLSGYSTLYPKFQQVDAGADPRLLGDYHYDTPGFVDQGSLEVTNPNGTSRFSWMGADRGPIVVTEETLNRVELRFAPGSASALLRTDTFYPGWHAETLEGRPVEMKQEREIFTRLEIPPTISALRLWYQPTGLRPGLAVMGLGILGLLWNVCRANAFSSNLQLRQSPKGP